MVRLAIWQAVPPLAFLKSKFPVILLPFISWQQRDTTGITHRFLRTIIFTRLVPKDWQVAKVGGVEGLNFQPVYTLRQARATVKDKVHRSDHTGVVYTTSCLCGAEYTGDARKTLGQCIKEHRKAFECNHPE